MFSKHKQGKPLGSQVRQVVNNVRLYFAKTKDDRIKEGDEMARCINVMKETSLATGISEWAVKMARKKTSGEAAAIHQIVGDQTVEKLSVWMILRSVH